MYNQIEDILLNISIVIATVWIVKRFWGSFFEEKQNSILSVSLWIVYCIFQFFFGYHNGRLQIFATILNILLILSIAGCLPKPWKGKILFIGYILCRLVVD